jgi:hypothetical protein
MPLNVIELIEVFTYLIDVKILLTEKPMVERIAELSLTKSVNYVTIKVVFTSFMR